MQRSAARGLGTIWKCCVGWAQFGSAAHGLGTVWKCRVGWAQVGSAGFSRAGHNLNAPASRELGTIWKCNLRVRHNLEAQLAGSAQFGNARFSRAWHEIEALISCELWQKYLELCAIWTRSSRIGRNLKVQPGCARFVSVLASRGLGRIYKRCAGWAQCGRAARALSTIWTCPLLAGWAQFGSNARVGHNLEVLRRLGAIWKCSSQVGHNLEVLRRLSTMWKCNSRVGHSVEVSASREPGTTWKCPLLADWAQFGSAARKLGII